MPTPFVRETCSLEIFFMIILLSGKKGWKAFNLPVCRLFKVFLYNTLPFAPQIVILSIGV